VSKDVIIFDGLGVSRSELVPSGTVAIIMLDGKVRIVPAENLRATMEKIGSDKIEGLTMSPPEFEKLRAFVDTEAANALPGSD
jgi:hypothetical protein